MEAKEGYLFRAKGARRVSWPWRGPDVLETRSWLHTIHATLDCPDIDNGVQHPFTLRGPLFAERDTAD